MIRARVLRWLMRRCARPADFLIGPKDAPYLRRWWVIPRNRWFNLYFHEILQDDDDRALHDHPWLNVSWLLRGSYIEHVPLRHPSRLLIRKIRRPEGSLVWRWAVSAHRLELPKSLGYPVPCWTLFMTGPVVRSWGFWCPQGWRRWQDFVSPNDKGQQGIGCGDMEQERV